MRLGYVNVNAMLHEITWVDWLHWRTYMELDPFVEERQDLRIGRLVQIIANVNRDSKQHPTPFTIDECRPKFGDQADPESTSKRKAQQSVEYIERSVRGWVRASNTIIEEEQKKKRGRRRG